MRGQVFYPQFNILKLFGLTGGIPGTIMLGYYGEAHRIVVCYRYLDPVKDDDMWLYVPALRRTLRAEAGQRSTPVQGLIQAEMGRMRNKSQGIQN